MKHELDLLGLIGAEVRFVYARHENWIGLSSTNSLANEKDALENELYIWFGSESIDPDQIILDQKNRYEGCCVFNGKWWMGGFGYAKDNAGQVWWTVVSPNQDGSRNSHQCWYNQPLLRVTHPPLPVPLY
jgi:hypothetical protein